MVAQGQGQGWTSHRGRVEGRAGWQRDVELDLRVEEEGELLKRSWRSRGSVRWGAAERGAHGTKAREKRQRWVGSR